MNITDLIPPQLETVPGNKIRAILEAANFGPDIHNGDTCDAVALTSLSYAGALAVVAYSSDRAHFAEGLHWFVTTVQEVAYQLYNETHPNG
jgi:hypothetical protein